MFAKLLKHEFKTTCRSLGILSIAALVSGAVGGLMLYFALQDVEDISRNILQTLSNLLLGGIYIGLFIFGAGSSIYLYYNFYKNKFTDEGYLTFTLPASTHQILLSSILNILIWEIILTVVLLLSYLFSVLPAVCHLIWAVKEELPSADVYFIINTQINPAIGACVKSACERYGATAIELVDIDKENGHPTPKGMETICNQVLSAIQ